MKSRRRWLTFSLSSLLVVATVVSIPLAWVGNEIQRARRVTNFYRELEELNIEFEEGDQYVLSAIIQRFYKNDVRHPTMLSSRSGQKELSQDFRRTIADLTELESLVLRHTNLRDDDLTALSGLTKLTHLDLYDNQISSVGLLHLSSLASSEGPKLKTLNLGSTNIDDDGLKAVSSISTLVNLVLSETNITDEGIEHISKLKTCRN